MSNRIQPTHHFDSDSLGDGLIRFVTYSFTDNLFWYFPSKSEGAIKDSDTAGFKIRSKTTQEKANSIYYPLNKQK